MTNENEKPVDDIPAADAGTPQAPAVKSNDANDGSLSDEQLEGVSGGLQSISFG